MANKLLKAALAYAGLGVPVLPVCWPLEDGTCACGDDDCHSVGKHPVGQLVPHGFKDATTDQDLIRAWWHEYPRANLGMPTGTVSGIVVVDVDSTDGFTSVADLGVTAPLTVITGRGGHLYFRHPGNQVRNFSGKYPGLDLRGDGGYVVVPPSRHVSGDSYSWVGDGCLPDFDALPQLPTVFCAPSSFSACARTVGAKAGKNSCHSKHTIQKGRRNDTLFRIGCSYRARGAPRDEIGKTLRLVNMLRCSPPVSDTEVASCVRSACRYPKGLVGGLL